MTKSLLALSEALQAWTADDIRSRNQIVSRLVEREI